jgi:hypothetical protein
VAHGREAQVVTPETLEVYEKLRDACRTIEALQERQALAEGALRMIRAATDREHVYHEAANDLADTVLAVLHEAATP